MLLILTINKIPMPELLLLTDYKNQFWSKYDALPYRSGMDKQLLLEYFSQNGFGVVFRKFSDIDFSKEDFNGMYVLYSSSEDVGNNYKSYIEDVIFGLSKKGAIVIPEYKYLKAHNNKVFMEILRGIIFPQNDIITTQYYGVLEDLLRQINSITFPCVIKSAFGAKSNAVFLANNKKELVIYAKRISRTPKPWYEIKDYLRRYKHKGYIPESRYQKKFIVQEFISGLSNDWKVLIFGEKYYILKRENRKNDFRASGSGKFTFEVNVPREILDFARYVKLKLKVPILNIDVAFGNSKCYLLEFQAIFFGTYALTYATHYFIYENDSWQLIESKSVLEKEFVNAIVGCLSS